MIPITELRCQYCNRLLMKFKISGQLEISIKCPKCKKINNRIFKSREV
ncbi:Com family DNA-binding transcriptional regulator [Desulfotomaculum defluvii]